MIIDCHTRELLGWHLSSSGKANPAQTALEQALITRYGTLGRVPTPFLLRSDNGLVFTSRSYTSLIRSYGLRQEFITPHNPEQNGMVEPVIRTLKEQCAHRHRFETLQHASRVISDWISFYNNRRPHQALCMKTPAATYALAEQIRLGHYRCQTQSYLIPEKGARQNYDRNRRGFQAVFYELLRICLNPTTASM